LKKNIRGKSKTYSLISIKLGEKLFAISTKKIFDYCELKEKIKGTKIPYFCNGLVNYQNMVIPVIDIGKIIGLGKIMATSKSCILLVRIIIDNEYFLIGVLVDSIKEILIKNTDIITLKTGNKYNMLIEYVIIQTHSSREFIQLLDIRTNLSADELLLLKLFNRRITDISKEKNMAIKIVT